MVSLDAFGYGDYPNGGISINFPSEYGNMGNWTGIPSGMGYNETTDKYVNISASFSTNSVRFFYNENITIPRCFIHLTYRIK